MNSSSCAAPKAFDRGAIRREFDSDPVVALRMRLEDAAPIAAPSLQGLEIRVACNQDELAMCFAIRSAVYIGEQSCPYAEEFDGNDHTATHVLALIDGEPAATVRVRWFAGWFKLERVSVRREFRGMARGRESVGRAISCWTFDLARRKGYMLGYAHARLDLLPFWMKLKEVGEIPGIRFTFSDHAYTAIRFDLEPDPAACSMFDDPIVLNRPEGQWHQPGPIDGSITRAPVNIVAQARTLGREVRPAAPAVQHRT
jgi:predicted GNAT family N-acyltransferase